MRFKCPNCETVYDVPENKLVRSAKLRCSVCGCVWKMTETPQEDFHEPETESFDPYADEIEGDFSRFIPKPPAEEETNEQVLNSFLETPFIDTEQQKRKNKRSAVVFFALGTLLLFVSIVLMGTHQTPKPSVSFENVRYFFEEKEFKRFLTMEGALINKTEQFVLVPEFDVRFFNKTGVNIANQKIPTRLEPLKPLEPAKFSFQIERPPATAESVELVLKQIQPVDVKETVTKTTNPS